MTRQKKTGLRVVKAAEARAEPKDWPIVESRNPRPTARAFLEHTGVVLVHQAGSFFQWNGACYRELPAAEVRSQLYAFLEESKCLNRESQHVDFRPNSRSVSDVQDALISLVTLSARMRAPAWLSDDPPDVDPLDVISFQNGLLQLSTRKLLSPTRDFFTLTALPFSYEANAPPPQLWLAFIEGLWPDDPESHDAIQEWMGLQLTTITMFQKILLLVGPPRCGKGVWSRVTKMLVGGPNYVALTLGSLGDRFGTQQLIGKSVAVVSDARTSKRDDGIAVAEKLLAISGEDSPTVQRKNLPDWQGALTSRFTLLANELPAITDASRALSSRFLVLKLTNSLLGKEIPGYESRFVPELPGVLNWALDGLDRLLQRGHFIQPASGRDLLEQISELSSPIHAFLQEWCEIGPDFEVSRSRLFTAWKTWCGENGHKTGSTATFGKDLRAALPGLQDGYTGHRVRIYRGLKLQLKVASAPHSEK